MDDSGVPNERVRTVRIAVIDDDLRVLESLVNLLASFGYSAESYGSAEQFLESGCTFPNELHQSPMSRCGK